MRNVFGIAILLSSLLLQVQAEMQDKAQYQEEESVSRDSETEAALTVSRAQASGPFGLRMGMSRVEIESAIGAPIKPVESKANLFSTATVPRPSDRVEAYVLLVLPDAGLCQIRALGVDISSSSHGVELRNAYEDLRDAIANAYGQYMEVNFLRSGSIWDEPEDWMMGLLRNERVLQAAWNSAEGSSMRNGAKEVLLTARAQRTSNGYLLLQYQFDNEDECTADMNKAAQEVF